MKKIMTAALTVLILAGWCFYQLGKQDNWYIRCGKGHCDEQNEREEKTR